jgi:cell division protein FtsN
MTRVKNYYWVIFGAILSLSACKSTESTYKQAYEKALQQDVVKAEVEEPASVVPVKVVDPNANAENITVREEKVSVVTGQTTLKEYSVVCGSFSLKTNADALRTRLVNDGYPAMVVVNEAGKTYRVVCDSFDNRQQAAQARDRFKAKYPDNQDFQASWILYNR